MKTLNYGLSHARSAILALVAGTLGAAEPPRPTDPFVISTDTATYGKRVSQQIPAIARVGSRWFCIWYGTNKGDPGTSGEGSGCYNILAVSDDRCASWKEVAYFVPNPDAVAQSIVDPRLASTPDGSLLIMIPVTGQKGRARSIWSVILTNPLATDYSFAFGPPTFVDFGFVGSPAAIDGKIYFTANQNTGAGPPPWPPSQGMKFHRIISYAENRIVTEKVGYLPYATADGRLNTFFETSIAATGSRNLLAFYRTPEGQYTTRSTDSGKSWSPAEPFTAHPDAKSTKADLARSPSGRLALAFNRVEAGRFNMCLALSSDGGTTWSSHHVFDDRKNPGTSYPNIQFGADGGGNYDGKIYVAYDHGRGKLPPEYTKEIVVAEIVEDSIVRGQPLSRRLLVSR